MVIEEACFPREPEAHWLDKNIHPDSVEASVRVVRSPIYGLGICPHSHIIEACGVLIGKTKEEIVATEHYCGSWSGSITFLPLPSDPLGDISQHRGGPKAMCREIATELGRMVLLAKTPRPRKNLLDNLDKLSKEKRDKVLAQLDRHNEGKRCHSQLKQGLQEVLHPGYRLDKTTVPRYTELFCQSLQDVAAGNAVHNIFFTRSFSCDQAPEEHNTGFIRC